MTFNHSAYDTPDIVIRPDSYTTLLDATQWREIERRHTASVVELACSP